MVMKPQQYCCRDESVILQFNTDELHATAAPVQQQYCDFQQHKHHVAQQQQQQQQWTNKDRERLITSLASAACTPGWQLRAILQCKA
jgi:hypothetical protein